MTQNQSQFQVWLLSKGLMDRFVWKGVSDNLCEIYRHDSTVVVDEELCSGPGYPANIKAGFAEPVTCSVL